MLDPAADPIATTVSLSDMEPGEYRVTCWDTLLGRRSAATALSHLGGTLAVPTAAFANDLALAVTRVGAEPARRNLPDRSLFTT